MRKKTMEMLKGYTALIAMWILIGTVVFKWIDLFIDLKRDVFIAMIGFVGSIIGGAITLLGVRMAIKDQNRRDFFNSIPLRYHHGVFVQTILVDYYSLLSEFLGQNHHYEFHIHLTNLVSRSEELLQKVATVSIEAYDYANDFLNLAFSLEHYMRSTNHDGTSQDERNQKYIEYLQEMNKSLFLYSDEIKKIKRDYSLMRHI
ncbi:hypothetical protein EEL30_09125 [Brevibacillus laterosporus]|uniref:Uncharacterized protein n=1 Tax=Brevibacillus laterosporus TaxID=1465 RepID=A0A518V655_BRELA|nr:hypothetical protein EEL30_09125 [Brevibacillus laterosporus]